MCRSSGAFGRPDAGDEKTPTGGEEVARVPAAGDASGSDHAVAGPEAEQLADWISELCETGSKHLPAALWLLAETPTSAWDLLHPTASDGKNQARLAEFEQLNTALSAKNAQKKPGLWDWFARWRAFAEWMKGEYRNDPEMFWVYLCELCTMVKPLGKVFASGLPKTAVLKALLADLDCHRPHLVPAVLRIMSSIPSCRVVMERWQPHERTPQQIIARKLIAFDFRVLRMVNRGDARSARLTRELIELVKELPESTGAPEQKVSVEDLPL